MLTAHFTSHEIPGTLGLVLFGLVLGAMAFGARPRARRWPALAAALLAATGLTVGILADQPAVNIAPLVGTLSDVALLVGCIGLIVLLMPDRRRPGMSVDSRPVWFGVDLGKINGGAVVYSERDDSPFSDEKGIVGYGSADPGQAAAELTALSKTHAPLG